MFGYSIQYPGSWLDVSKATGDGAGARSFSNEAVKDNRLTGLDEKGIVFRVAVAPLDGRCIPGGYENRPFTPFTASVDGVTGTVAGYDSRPPADPESNVFIDVGRANQCYMFMATTKSAATRDSFIPLFLQMLSTFRFGSGS